ncbi:hypothetical protein ONZ51_g12306 [Trametes cubensis]|uniref:Aminoglycoside phosphotransferase domain-containing protein n=1 Tax=Trametes cubensis TaxID=1111947 RepID=A0AAD7TFY3_9APHY|nr:hypothetical protein ONZ51_g12306 [Trametes cubensis]
MKNNALVDVATQAAGANRCTSIDKVQDGILNRVLSLKFDNDAELIAKIPFPVAGPKHFCTASEVATMDYLRTEHGIPTPVVRAWCSRAESSPVGIEYILYDKIPGVQLALLDRNDLPLEDDPFIEILLTIQAIETRLAAVVFSQIGSIYYKEDVPEPLRNRPLYAKWITPKANSARFCIGPTVDREFWRAGRAALDIDRGPWPDAQSWMSALGAWVRASIAGHPGEQVKQKYNGLISDYEQLVPHIAPKKNKHFILWHPDFYPRNILISEGRPSLLNGIIDWQGAIVTLDSIQLMIPPVYDCEPHPLVVWSDSPEELPTLAVDLNSLDDDKKQDALLAYRRAERKRVHEIILWGKDPTLAKEMFDMRGAVAKRSFLQPVLAITRGMTEGLTIIRKSLLECRTMWPLIKGEDVPFPLDIPDADVQRIDQEWDLLVREEKSRSKILEGLGIEAASDGSVDADRYDAIKHAFDEAKARALEKVDSMGVGLICLCALARPASDTILYCLHIRNACATRQVSASWTPDEVIPRRSITARDIVLAMLLAAFEFE